MATILRGKRKGEKVEIEQWCELPLPCGRVALVDVDDLPLVGPHSWYRDHSTGYVLATIPGRGRFSLHRFILGLERGDGLDGEHRNHDPLDNRRCNLRRATRSQNNANQRSRGGTSRFKGVYRRKNAWRARIMVHWKLTDLGTFAIEEDAARAYDEKAWQAWGEFAHLNFPRGCSGSDHQG